ncbi:MAG: prolipoprotein diacylglyceryl transferase [Chloroflexia bacterium]|nr:prolipoprotein diacylglyceryl transferase [Chloroflexia bacterium]
MYPLIPLGPLNLSSGGLLLLLGIMVGMFLSERIARQRGGAELADQVSRLTLPLLAGAVVGGRLWYGLFNWDLYGRNPGLFVALRVADLAWAGALIGGMVAVWLWCRWRRCDLAPSADVAALTLPLVQAIASLGLLLSGEAFGMPTALPWGIPLFGTMRHPTQIYLMLAALISYGLLQLLARRSLAPGALFAVYLWLQGLTMLLLEPLRGDALLTVFGLRIAQIVGLSLMLGAMRWGRKKIQLHPDYMR